MPKEYVKQHNASAFLYKPSDMRVLTDLNSNPNVSRGLKVMAPVVTTGLS